jgi:hypothetical protein
VISGRWPGAWRAHEAVRATFPEWLPTEGPGLGFALGLGAGAIGLGLLALAFSKRDETPEHRQPIWRPEPRFHLVRNIVGAAGRLCACGSWREHFERKTIGQVPYMCPVFGCHNAVEVGAHVYWLDFGGREHHIVPMCRACKNSKLDLLIDGSIHPVWANSQAMGCYRA